MASTSPSQRASDDARDIFSQFLSAPSAGDALSGTLLLVSIDQVEARQSQPRTHFDVDSIRELASDIKGLRERGGGVGGSGILQPLTVSETETGRFLIVTGERRFRAARLANCDKIPVIVREGSASDDEFGLWEDALRENLQREDLSPLEEARAIATLMERGQLSVRAVAARLGKGKGYIEHRLALAKAGQDVQELVARRRDTLSIAREIDRIATPRLRRELIQSALGGASVSALRARIETASRPVEKVEKPDIESEEPTSQVALVAESAQNHSTKIKQITAAAALLESINPTELAVLDASERAEIDQKVLQIENWLAEFKAKIGD